MFFQQNYTKLRLPYTTKEFCEKVLAPYFIDKEIHIQAPLIKKSKGGIVKWPVLKKQICHHLKEDSVAFVTTFIDYYGLKAEHNSPDWNNAQVQRDKNFRMDILENAMLLDLPNDLRYRFIPYLQLHEFEGLLFSKIEVFYDLFQSTELIGDTELIETVQNFENPELINDQRETSPSHRLERIIDGYDKIVYGNILAEAIGLQNIREKCPRFNKFLSKIEAKASATIESS